MQIGESRTRKDTGEKRHHVILRILTIKSFVLENLRTIRTIEDVAAPFDISPETLRKEFQRKAHIPLSKYILLSRVERAKHLLIYTDLKCSEICHEVGFRREDTGAARFKRVAGTTMRSYRVSHRITSSANQMPPHDPELGEDL